MEVQGPPRLAASFIERHVPRCSLQPKQMGNDARLAGAGVRFRLRRRTGFAAFDLRFFRNEIAVPESSLLASKCE